MPTTIPGHARRRIVRDFVASGATAVDRAIPYIARDRRIFRTLRAHGAIVEDDGRFHLDAHRLGVFRIAMRRRIAALAVASGLAASAAAAMTLLALAE